jgi:hypothetical protein
MTNDDEIAARGGLLPVQFPYGNYRKTLYKLTTSAAAAVYIGQPMQMSAGEVKPADPGDNNAILGPALGFVDSSKAGLSSGVTKTDQGGYLPANTDAYVQICDDPMQLFQMQGDSGGTAMSADDVGERVTFIFRTSSGSTTTGYSTAEVDQSDVAADTGGALQVVGLVDRMNSDGTANDYGNYVKLLVRIVNHNLISDIGQSGID